MSVRSIIAGDGVGTYNNQRDIPIAKPPVVTNTSSAWTRPGDWPALATINTTDEKFSGLIAITNDADNYVALTITGNNLAQGSLGICNGISTSTAGNLLYGTSFSVANYTFIKTYNTNMLITGTGVTAGTYITAANFSQFNVSTSSSSTTMTVTSVTSGTIQLGMTINNNSVRVIAFGTGTGGVGTYTLSAAVTLSSATLYDGYYITVNTSQLVASTAITFASNFTVDWGDGQVYTNVSGSTGSGTIIQKQYNYSTYSSSVLSAGYKAALVNITLIAGQLTGINLQTRYVIGSPYPVLPSGVTTKWLDISVGGPNLTSLFIGGGTTYLSYLQRAQIFSVNSSFVTVGAALFSSCFQLQNVPTLNFPSNYNTLNGIFGNCYNLKISPTFPASSVTVNGTSIFGTCNSLETVTANNFIGINFNSCSNMFSGCNSLKMAPNLNVSACTTMANMFNACNSLISVPQYNTTNTLTSTSGMFTNCFALKSVPLFNTSNVNTMLNMFSACRNLGTIPQYNTVSVTTTASMFNNCYALTTVSLLNLPVCTSMSGMFNGCFSLTTVGTITTSTSLTDIANMFSSCYNLRIAPIITVTSNVTTMSNMFSNCNSLISIPAYGTGTALINTASMFTGCYSLLSVPVFNTINVSDMNNMFNTCGILVCPAFNTSNVVNMASMFNACYNLSDVLFTNTSKVANMYIMFGGCNSFAGSSVWNSWDTSKVTNMFGMFNVTQCPIVIPTWNTINVANIGSMFSSVGSINSIPALNFSNVTAAGSAFNTNPGLTRIQATGIKVTTAVNSTNLNKTALEEIFANTLASNVSSQTLTITNCPGADTVVSKTGNVSINSSIVVIANTVGITANMVATGTNISANVTANSFANDGSWRMLPPIANGAIVSLTTQPLASTWEPGRPYYVVNSSNTANGIFYLSLTQSGPVYYGSSLDSSATLRRAPKVLTVNANANVILDNGSTATVTGQTLTFRNLDTRIASVKGWIIAG